MKHFYTSLSLKFNRKLKNATNLDRHSLKPNCTCLFNIVITVYYVLRVFVKTESSYKSPSLLVLYCLICITIAGISLVCGTVFETNLLLRSEIVRDIARNSHHFWTSLLGYIIEFRLTKSLFTPNHGCAN